MSINKILTLIQENNFQYDEVIDLVKDDLPYDLLYLFSQSLNNNVWFINHRDIGKMLNLNRCSNYKYLLEKIKYQEGKRYQYIYPLIDYIYIKIPIKDDKYNYVMNSNILNYINLERSKNNESELSSYDNIKDIYTLYNSEIIFNSIKDLRSTIGIYIFSLNGFIRLCSKFKYTNFKALRYYLFTKNMYKIVNNCIKFINENAEVVNDDSCIKILEEIETKHIEIIALIKKYKEIKNNNV